MILSSEEILSAYLNGNITITPFDKSKLNPNSYNLTLANELVMYDSGILDMKEDNPYTSIEIPEDGYCLLPHRLYLARTNEFTETRNYIPMIEGRSSIGRLGIFIHATAGFGDEGFRGYWTLEISCVQPVIIYPNVDICQIYYHTMKGTNSHRGSYNGKYQGNTGIQTSQIFKEFQK